MAITQLGLYNNALTNHLGLRKLATLSDAVESRRVLDDIWDSGGAVKHVLELGFWKFALRTVTLTPSMAVPPTGWTYAYDYPSDFVREYSLCTDDRFNSPVQSFLNEGNKWYTDENPIYLRYISNGASYGLNYSLWPETFARYVESYLAARAVKRLTDSKADADDLEARSKKLLTRAKSNDAMKENTKYPLPSGWQLARTNGEGYRRRQHPYR